MEWDGSKCLWAVLLPIFGGLSICAAAMVQVAMRSGVVFDQSQVLQSCLFVSVFTGMGTVICMRMQIQRELDLHRRGRAVLVGCASLIVSAVVAGYGLSTMGG